MDQWSCLTNVEIQHAGAQHLESCQSWLVFLFLVPNKSILPFLTPDLWSPIANRKCRLLLSWAALLGWNLPSFCGIWAVQMLLSTPFSASELDCRWSIGADLEITKKLERGRKEVPLIWPLTAINGIITSFKWYVCVYIYTYIYIHIYIHMMLSLSCRIYFISF